MTLVECFWAYKAANLREFGRKARTAGVPGPDPSIASGVGKVLETITPHCPTVLERIHHFFAGRGYS